MPNALVPLASFTLTASQATVVFSGIPTTGYQDLQLLVNNTITSTTANMKMQFNNDTGTNYYVSRMGFNWQPTIYADNTPVSAIEDTRGYPTSSGGSIATFDIMNYASSLVWKSTMSRHQGNPTTNGQGLDMILGRWNSYAPINTITLSLSGGSFAAGATFNLYGVL